MRSIGSRNGFTLAEVLIALAILGVIAAFTIPKVLVSQRDSKYKSAAKEIAGAIASAHRLHSARNGIQAGTSIAAMTQYLNYIAVDSAGTIDEWHNGGTRACTGYFTCLKLHSGGTLLYATNDAFLGTGTTDAVYFIFDPDGRVTDGTTNGPGKSVLFWLYANGKLTSFANALPSTVYTAGTVDPEPTYDPPWFSW